MHQQKNQQMIQQNMQQESSFPPATQQTQTTSTQQEVTCPRTATEGSVDQEGEALRHTINELSRSVKALADSEIDSQSNCMAKHEYDQANGYVRAYVYVSNDESFLRSSEKRKLKQAMQIKISTSIQAYNALQVRPPLETCGPDETVKTSLARVLETKSSDHSHPFFDLEPADLLRLTPYYMPYYLGGIDPRPEGWRESLGVFPPGYPGEVRSHVYPILTATSLTVILGYQEL
jgi:hypothetical protein